MYLTCYITAYELSLSLLHQGHRVIIIYKSLTQCGVVKHILMVIMVIMVVMVTVVMVVL